MKELCNRGHARISTNLDKTGHCKECKKLHQANYVLANIDKVREHHAQYFLNNKDTISQKGKDYRVNFPEVVENTKLKLRYGITIADREKMLQNQDYKCAICKFEFDYTTKARKPYIDHSHITN